jgi:transposase
MEAHGLAAHKKNAARLGAHIVFVDESGFLLIPPVRKTWAPRAETPIIRHHARRDRISVISGISVSPTRTHIGLYYRLHRKNIQQAEVCEFLHHLLKHLRGHVIAIWDNGKIHKGEPIREMCRRFPRLHLERFPSYAPELNPDEGVWSSTKQTLANGRPDNLDELSRHLVKTLRDLSRSQPALRACIHESDIPSFLR